MRESADKNLLYSYRYNRVLAWESTFTKPGKLSWCGKSTGSVTENYLRRRQRHSELRSNDIVLIQEHKQFEIVVSGIPSPGA